MDTHKANFDLSNCQGANSLLNLLENGTIQDIDEEIDAEIIQEIPPKNVVIWEEDILEKENLEEEEPTTGSSSKPKNEIIWRKYLYQSSFGQLHPF
ncbi:hypothetical protein HHI36_000934 [Cryptolaemus montrouzieri]|uniref:Uncharacterized protein n=1 Tax=Cryptolaemus montrouzieri TaxID=559131 RepID=A0ABD2P689_9CUCU